MKLGIYILRFIIAIQCLLFTTICLAATPVHSKTINMIYYAPADKDFEVLNKVLLDVWNQAAQDAGFEVNLLKTNNEQEAFAWLQSNKGDIIVGPLQYQQNQGNDFINSNVSLQTGVLIASNVALTIWDKVVILLQIIFGKPVFILFIVLLFFSVLVWLLDHKHANSPFSHEPLKGIARAFWFQASTFTTVAYGDTVPARASSKAVTLASIFLYVFLLSAFIASMTAEITVLQTATARITSLTELHDKKVGYLKTEPLAKEDIEKYSGRALPYDSLEDAVKALVEHRISAVFASRLQLRYFLTIHPESDVLLTRFDIYHGDYTFMLKPDAPYESRINMSLYKVKLSGKLDEIIARYVGHDHAALANS